MPKERLDRAKQFMPFDALKGLKEALHEKEVEVERKVTLSEEKQEEINEILTTLKVGDSVEITYYENGKYQMLSMKIEKFSICQKKLSINGKTIYFKDIRDMKIID